MLLYILKIYNKPDPSVNRVLLCQCDLYFFYILLLIPPSTYLTQMSLFISSDHLTEIHLNQINFGRNFQKTCFTIR